MMLKPFPPRVRTNQPADGDTQALRVRGDLKECLLQRRSNADPPV
jgi:hypothetical protein